MVVVVLFRHYIEYKTWYLDTVDSDGDVPVLSLDCSV